MLVSAFILSLMAQNQVIVSAPWHFGFVVLSLLAAGVFSTLASAAQDGLYAWPKGGPVDPPPFKLLPSIEWSNSGNAMQINFYLISTVFAVVAFILTIMAGGNRPHILFAEGFHFFVWAVFAVLSAGCLMVGAILEDHGGRWAQTRAMWIISVAAAVMAFVSAVMAGGNPHPHIILSEGFHFGFFVTTLAVSAIACYRAGRLADRHRSRQDQTTINLFIIAAAMAVVALITAMVGNKAIIFSVGFHIGLVVVYAVLAACAAIYAALLKDRDNS